MTPLEQHRARRLIDAAAELDPDVYVPVLDALDEGNEDREDGETEPNCDEDAGPEHDDHVRTLSVSMGSHYGHGVRVVEHCPCCGAQTGEEWWTT